MSDNVMKFFEGAENFVRQKMMPHENFVQEACIFGMFYWTKVTVFTLCGENFVRHCFVR